MINFKVLILFVLMSVTSVYAQTAKVVYDLTTGDSHQIESKLINSLRALSKYYKEEKIELKAVVVISGDAYKYFIDDIKQSPYANDDDVFEMQGKFRHRLLYLSESLGVTFNMCATGMHARDISKESLYKYVHADVMKSVYLIEAQNDGYAYIPIH